MASSAPIVTALGVGGPLRLTGQIGLVLTGTLILTISAQITVPMWPVEMSLQTLAVLMVGALFGARIGTATVLAYLAQGVVGLPVFQGTPEHGIGFAYMVGPTGGYLVGFVAMAALAGWAADRGWARSPAKMLAAMLAGEAIMLTLGAAWLAVLFGFERAFAWGIGPFILPDLVKVCLAVCFALGASRVACRLKS